MDQRETSEKKERRFPLIVRVCGEGKNPSGGKLGILPREESSLKRKTGRASCPWLLRCDPQASELFNRWRLTEKVWWRNVGVRRERKS